MILLQSVPEVGTQSRCFNRRPCVGCRMMKICGAEAVVSPGLGGWTRRWAAWWGKRLVWFREGGKRGFAPLDEVVGAMSAVARSSFGCGGGGVGSGRKAEEAEVWLSVAFCHGKRLRPGVVEGGQGGSDSRLRRWRAYRAGRRSGRRARTRGCTVWQRRWFLVRSATGRV